MGQCPLMCNACKADKTIGDWWVPAPAVNLTAGTSEHIFKSAQDRGPFWFSYILNKVLQYILKYGMNLKMESSVQIFRKIIQLNVVIILKTTNEYYRKIISKSGHKMDLYPAMCAFVYTVT